MSDAPNGKSGRVHFDPTINLGHMLTALVFLTSTLAAWFSLSARVDHVSAAAMRLEEVVKAKADKDVMTRGELELSRRIVDNQQQQNAAFVRIDDGFRELKALMRDVDQKLDKKMDKPR